VQGLVAGVGAWLCLLFGFDLVALLAAQWPAVQQAPDAWVAVLMLNPLDAFRIQALFALEQIPPESADKTPLAHWWLANAGTWMAGLSTVWTSVLLFVAVRAFNRMEF
jgi:hypothetical protein